MNKTAGFSYVVDVKGNVDEFAKVILRLVNLKSSVPNSIASVKTLDGTNLIQVVAYKDSTSYLEEFGTITYNEPVEIQTYTYDDLNKKVQAEIQKQDDEELAYFVQIEDWQA